MTAARVRFAEAGLRRYCRAIGDWIEANRRMMGKTHEHIAHMLDVDVSTVTKWINGDSNISQKNLTRLLSRFSGNDVPLIYPSPVELAVEGYRAALGFVRLKLNGEARTPPTREEVYCLFHLYSAPDWAKMRGTERWDCHYRPLASSILKRASLYERIATGGEGRCRIETGEGNPCPREAGCRNLAPVRFLNSLISTWGMAWLICIELLPEEGAI